MADEYEVKRIVGRRVVYPSPKRKQERQYLIEWEGYTDDYNTWESETNLLGNTHLVDEFVTAYLEENGVSRIMPHTRALLKGVLDTDPAPRRYRIPQAPKRPTKSRSASSKLNTEPSTTPPLLSTPLSTSSDLSSVISTPPGCGETEEEQWMDPIKASTTVIVKKRVKVDHPDWKMKHSDKYSADTLDVIRTAPLPRYMSIQDAAQSEKELTMMMDMLETARTHASIHRRPLIQNKKTGILHFEGVHPLVTVKNDQDKTIFPGFFIYVDDLVLHSSVPRPPPEFLSGCDCMVRCNDWPISYCHDKSAYSQSGQLERDYSGAIFECNQACQCDPTECLNRVVQKGRQVPLEIFKTKKKGWGVRAVEAIQQGRFVEQYVGEVIPDEQGVERGKIYDRIGISYLFNMDLDGQPKYVIDSYLVGNASHYLNHSCDPNLIVYGVFYDSADPSFHRLAFFTKRNVAAGEELTFDYIGSDAASDGTKSKRFPCYCDSSKCRSWIHL